MTGTGKFALPTCALQLLVALACRTTFVFVHYLVIRAQTRIRMLAPHGAVVAVIVLPIDRSVDVQPLPAQMGAPVPAGTAAGTGWLNHSRTPCLTPWPPSPHPATPASPPLLQASLYKSSG